jgi:hypothetical protein
VADTVARIVLAGIDRSGAAFTSAKRNLAALTSSAAAFSARVAPLLGTVGLLGGALSAVSFTSLIDGIDALNDVKDATGASIENISALENIGARTGTSFDTVSASLVKLNQVLKDINPESPAARAIKSIGLSIEELRRLDPAEALRRVALALNGYSDEGDKARIVQELFGRSVRETAPFINDLAKAGELNATVTTNQAAEAEKFNQQLFALGKNTRDAARGIASDFVPALNDILKAFNERGLLAALDVFGNKAFDWENSQTRKQIKVLQGDLKDLQAQASVVDLGFLDKIKAVGAAGALALTFGGTTAPEIDADIAAKRKQLDDLNAKLAPAGGGRGFVNPPVVDTRPPAPRLGGTGGAAPDQVALFKTQLQARQQAIQQTLSNEQDILRFNEQFVQEIYRSSSISLESAFQAQDELRRRNVEEIRRASDATIQAEQDFQAKLPKPKDAAGRQRNDVEVEQSEARITAARVKLQAAEREFDQATSLAAVQRPEQRAQLSQQVQQFEAALQDMVTGGRARASELADIAVQTREATRLLIEGGADPAVAQQRAQVFGQQLERQRDLNLARDRFAEVTRKASEEEERFVIAANARGDSRDDVERGLFEIRSRSLAQMGDMVRQAEDLATAADPDSPAVLFARELRLEFERAAGSVDPLRDRLLSLADETGKTWAGAIEDALLDGDWEKAGETIMRDLARGLINEQVTQPLQQAVSQLLRGGVGTPGTNTGGGLGSLLGGVFGTTSPTTVPGFAGGQIDVSKPLDVLGSTATDSAAQLAGLGKDSALVSQIMSLLPTAAITPTATAMSAFNFVGVQPATASLTSLAAMADAAASALSGIAGGGGESGGLFDDLVGAFFGGSDMPIPWDLGFSAGGYTGNAPVQAAAGFVHGKEFVFSAPAVQTLGVDRLDQLHTAAKNGLLPGYAQGGYVDVLGAGLPAWTVGEPAAGPLAPLDRAIGRAADDPTRADMLAQSLDDPFAELERFHRGGISHEEQLAVVLRNEEILTASDPRHSDNGGAVVQMNVRVINQHPRAQVSTQQGQDGTLEVLITELDKRMGASIAAGRGEVWHATKRRAGLNDGAVLVT